MLSDPKLEDFVEELDDNLMCERAANDRPPEPFLPDEFDPHDAKPVEVEVREFAPDTVVI